MQAYRYNWPAIGIIDLQTPIYNTVQTFNFKLRILGVRLQTLVSDSDFGLWTSDFGFWTPGFEQTYVVLQTLDIIQTVFEHALDIKLQVSSDFVHQTSDCGLQTSVFRLLIVDFGHTSDIGL